MKLPLRPRTFVLSLTTLGALTLATALVVACGEMDKTKTVTNTETTQVVKDLDAMEGLVKNLKIDPVVATHNALTWLNIPPFTATSQLSVQSEWAVGPASSVAGASKLVWQKSLPSSASAVHSERHLWVRISPKEISTNPALTRYLDLTQSSGIQKVRTNLDVLININPSLQLNSLKLSGPVDKIVLENAPAIHPGLALQWSARVGTTIGNESWYDWSGFTTLLRATRPTTTDLQTIRVRYALVDAALYQLKSTFETKPALIQISPFAVETSVDVLSEIKNVLGQTRVDVTNSVHSGLVWLNVPQLATSWASELLSIEYRTSLGGTTANLEYSDWSSTLPSVTAFASNIRTITARITPQRGVSWPVTELDMTNSSEIARVLSLLDEEPEVRAALTALNLSKVQLSTVETYGIFGPLSVRTNNDEALATLKAHQIELRFAYQKTDQWLTFDELQVFVETDEAFANYKSGDFGQLEGGVLARLEYLGTDKQLTLRDRKIARVDVRAVTPLSNYTVAERVTRLVRRVVVVNTNKSTHYNLVWPLLSDYQVQLTPAMKAGIKNLEFTYTYDEPSAANPNPSLITFSKLPNITITDYTKRTLTGRVTTLNNVVVDFDLTESSQIKKVKRLIDQAPNYSALEAPQLLINLTDKNREWKTLLVDPSDSTTFDWNTNLFLYAKGNVDYAAYEQIGVRLKSRITYNGQTKTIELASLPTLLARWILSWKRTAQPGDIFSIEKIEIFFVPLDEERGVITADKTKAIFLSENINPSFFTEQGFTPFTAK